MEGLFCCFQLGLQYNSYNNTIDSHCFTENNTAQAHSPHIKSVRERITTQHKTISIAELKFLVYTQTDVVYLMRFLEVMRGALIAAPKRLLPVIYMPLFGPRPNEECNIRYVT